MGFLLGLELADVFCLAVQWAPKTLPFHLHWKRLEFLECATTPGSFTWLLGIRLSALYLQSKPSGSYLPTLRPLSLFFPLKFMTFSSSKIFYLGIPFSTSLLLKSRMCPFSLKKHSRFQKLPVAKVRWCCDMQRKLEGRSSGPSSGFEIWARVWNEHFDFTSTAQRIPKRGEKLLEKQWEDQWLSSRVPWWLLLSVGNI